MSGQHGGRSEEKFLGNVECFFLVVISSLKAWYVCFFWKYTKRKQQTNKQTRLVFFFFLFLFFCRYKETTDVFKEITSAEKYSKFLRPFHKGNRQKKCIVTLNARNPKLRDQPRKGPNMVLWALKRVFMVLRKGKKNWGQSNNN